MRLTTTVLAKLIADNSGKQGCHGGTPVTTLGIGPHPNVMNFGVELEIPLEYGPRQREEEFHKALQERIPGLYTWHHDGGIEIDSVPLPYKDMCLYLDRLLGKPLPHATRSDDSGMHIHVSKEYCQGEHLARLIRFMSDQSAEFKTFLHRHIAHRNNHWSSIATYTQFKEVMSGQRADTVSVHDGLHQCARDLGHLRSYMNMSKIEGSSYGYIRLYLQNLSFGGSRFCSACRPFYDVMLAVFGDTPFLGSYGGYNNTPVSDEKMAQARQAYDTYMSALKAMSSPEKEDDYAWTSGAYPKGTGLAINRNHGTHEFRLFKTTTNVLEAKANLDFVRASIYWTRTGQVGQRSVETLLNLSKFKEFITNNQRRFPFLHKHWTQRGALR